jgi:hypothetical protein
MVKLDQVSQAQQHPTPIRERWAVHQRQSFHPAPPVSGGQATVHDGDWRVGYATGWLLNVLQM